MNIKSLLCSLLLCALLLSAGLSAAIAAELAEEDMALGGIHIGDSSFEVELRYGAPERIEDGAQGFFAGQIVPLRTYYYFGDYLQVRFLPDAARVYDVMLGLNDVNAYGHDMSAHAHSIATPHGIHLGSTRADLESAYGYLPPPKCGHTAPPVCVYSYSGESAQLAFYICAEHSPGIRSIWLHERYE